MARNFDNPYSANLVGLWDFRGGFETSDTGLGDGIAQNGAGVGGVGYAGGWMVADGSNDRFDVAGAADAPFDLDQGTLITGFKQFGHTGSAPQTVVSRGGATESDGLLQVRVLDDGAVEVVHRMPGSESILTTGAGFFGPNDEVVVTYSWSPSGPVMKVENLTQGTETQDHSDVAGLTLDVTGAGENSFVIGALQQGDGSHAQNFDGLIDYVAVLDAPVVGLGDGIVEGGGGDDLIDLAYTGDPEGDVIDGGDALLAGEGPDDDIVDAGAGNDTVQAGAGDDEIYGGSGGDSLDGGVGDDVIRGDSGAPGGGAGGTVRECFLWDEAPDPDDGGVIDDEDDLSGGFSQDTGHVTVTYSVLSESPGVDTEYSETEHYVGNINTGGAPADDTSGLKSLLNGAGNSAAYQLGFSDAVQDVSFRVNDIDGDGVVRISAFDAAGNPVVVNLAGGPGISLSDADGVPGNDTADSDGGYASPTNTNYSLLVTIPGPVSRLVIEHEQDSIHNSGIYVTDVYFDVPLADTGPAGDDTLIGGGGDDMLYGEGGDDSLSGGDGSDLIEGGDGDDVIDAGKPGLALPDRGFPGYGAVPPIPADADPMDDRDTVDGGAGDDVIRTGDDNDVIQGGSGDDTIDGGLDDDLIDGGDDDDLIVGGEGADTIQGGAGDDVIYGGLDPSFPDSANIRDDLPGALADPDQTNGRDVIDGGAGNDRIFGQDDDDDLRGGAGDDWLDGGIDEDTLRGDAGDDTLLGGQGADLLLGGDDRDVIGIGVGDVAEGGEGGDDFDTLIATGLATVEYTGGDPASESGIITFYNDDLTVAGTATFSEIEQVLVVGATTGTAFEDPATGPIPGVTALDGIVEGTAGSDVIDLGYLGDPEGDLVDGDDAVPPLTGEQDVILAGAGDDTVYGREDDDVIFGASGDDRIEGNDGNDAIDGGCGDDYIDGGAGRDIIAAGCGDDTISGSNDVPGDAGDLIFAQEGDDRIFNVSAGDVIDGGEDFDGLDQDVLSLRGVAEANNPGGSLTVEYDPANGENGTVRLFDAGGTETGTIEFRNIENVVVCFTPGTLIATPMGERLVETLAVGDRVITRDNGIQQIRWVGARSLASDDLALSPHLRPVLIRRGALGHGLPERDMMLSPNHRVLMSDARTALYFDETEVLVAAKHLVGKPGIEWAKVEDVTYIHFLCDCHEVVLSDGAWTESFQPGDHSLAGLGEAQRREIFELFPELETRSGLDGYQAARRSLKRHEAALLVHG